MLFGVAPLFSDLHVHNVLIYWFISSKRHIHMASSMAQLNTVTGVPVLRSTPPECTQFSSDGEPVKAKNIGSKSNGL